MRDFVYFKLQPHRQVRVRQGIHHKLSAKFYGPFEVESRVGKVAYKLKLPAIASIHPVFHVSQLKLCHDTPPSTPVMPDNSLSSTSSSRGAPVAILDRKLSKRNGRPVMLVLIQWTNGGSDAATREVYEDLILEFPSFDSI